MPLRAMIGFLLGFALLAVGALICADAITESEHLRLWMFPPALLPGAITLALAVLVLKVSGRRGSLDQDLAQVGAMESMEDWRFRRSVQHWSIVVLGIFIPAAALLGESSDIAVPMNATLLSLILLGSTAFEFLRLPRWQDASEFICGVWLIGSPFAFGYDRVGQLRYWHIASGVLLIVLAVFNLWKDRNARRPKI